jgi:hypothetical protein
MVYILDLTTARVNRPKYLLICNPYLDLSKLICIFRSLIIQVQKVGLPKNTKTKKKQTVNHAYASRIDLHRVNGLVPAFDGQPTWTTNQKNIIQTDSNSRGQHDVDACVFWTRGRNSQQVIKPRQFTVVDIFSHNCLS